MAEGASESESVVSASSTDTQASKKGIRAKYGTFQSEVDRILQPGHEFFNLNPFEVLKLPLDHTQDDLRKHYRLLSVIIHPDKNPDEPRAQVAFDFVSEANKKLKDGEQMIVCQNAVKEARRRLHEHKEKGHYINQENGKKMVDPEAMVPTDATPEARSAAERLMVTKIFIEHKTRQDEIARLAQANKRREEESRITKEREVKRVREEAKQWEESREDRVSDWRSWQTDGSKKQKLTGLKPKLKVEKREDKV